MELCPSRPLPGGARCVHPTSSPNPNSNPCLTLTPTPVPNQVLQDSVCALFSLPAEASSDCRALVCDVRRRANREPRTAQASARPAATATATATTTAAAATTAAATAAATAAGAIASAPPSGRPAHLVSRERSRAISREISRGPSRPESPMRTVPDARSVLSTQRATESVSRGLRSREISVLSTHSAPSTYAQQEGQ